MGKYVYKKRITKQAHACILLYNIIHKKNLKIQSKQRKKQVGGNNKAALTWFKN